MAAVPRAECFAAPINKKLKHFSGLTIFYYNLPSVVAQQHKKETKEFLERNIYTQLLSYLTGPIFKDMRRVSNSFRQPLTFKYRFQPLLTWAWWKSNQMYFSFSVNHWAPFCFVPLDFEFPNRLIFWFLVNLCSALLRIVLLWILIFYLLDLFVCFVAFTLCHLLLRCRPLASSLCSVPRSRPCWLKPSESPGWLGWWIICSTNLLRLLPLFDPVSASHTVEAHRMFPVFQPCSSFSVTARWTQRKQTCLTFPPLEIYRRPS